MPRFIIPIPILLILVIGFTLSPSASGESQMLYTGWGKSATTASEYFASKDYNAAWLFFEKAIANGCDDGKILFQAAESFRLQTFVSNPDFSKNLYATAWYFLSRQYPENSLSSKSRERAGKDRRITRSLVYKTYSIVGGRAPIQNFQERGLSQIPWGITGFFLERFETLRQLWMVFRTNGILSVYQWAKGQMFDVILSLFVLSMLSGIILPVVLAIAIAKEGRKSYITAYAFLLHWGFFGIHRFYLGRFKSGVLWLLTGGLLGFGLFFDIFLTGAYVRFWNESNKSALPTEREKPSINRNIPRYIEPTPINDNDDFDFSAPSFNEDEFNNILVEENEESDDLSKDSEEDDDDDFDINSI